MYKETKADMNEYVIKLKLCDISGNTLIFIEDNK